MGNMISRTKYGSLQNHVGPIVPMSSNGVFFSKDTPSKTSSGFKWGFPDLRKEMLM
jgi:hypothetical protein